MTITGNVYAVIPSKNRLNHLNDLTESLIDSDVMPVVIDTGYTEELRTAIDLLGAVVIQPDDDALNISNWWNLGIDQIREYERHSKNEYYIAVLNDDISIGASFISTLVTALDTSGASAASPDPHMMGTELITTIGPTSPMERMCGYAFMLRGSSGIRADPNLRWWYGDDDIDWKARVSGGMMRVGGLPVQHFTPNGWAATNPELQEQTRHDRETFIKKWGMAPW